MTSLHLNYQWWYEMWVSTDPMRPRWALPTQRFGLSSVSLYFSRKTCFERRQSEFPSRQESYQLESQSAVGHFLNWSLAGNDVISHLAANGSARSGFFLSLSTFDVVPAIEGDRLIYGVTTLHQKPHEKNVPTRDLDVCNEKSYTNTTETQAPPCWSRKWAAFRIRLPDFLKRHWKMEITARTRKRIGKKKRSELTSKFQRVQCQ